MAFLLGCGGEESALLFGPDREKEDHKVFFSKRRGGSGVGWGKKNGGGGRSGGFLRYVQLSTPSKEGSRQKGYRDKLNDSDIGKKKDRRAFLRVGCRDSWHEGKKY